MDSCHLVLASASPRRLELLSAFNLQLQVDPVDIDERPAPGEQPAAMAQRLAGEKAAAAARRHPGRVVLAADTVVTVDGSILGKPADAAEAAAMLRRLSGREHEVYTAVAAQRDDVAAARLSRSEVEFRALGDAEVAAYVASGEPLDKAGAYGIQGRAAVFITRLSGSYSGVVGLPLAETHDLLREFGIELLGRAGAAA